MPVVYETRWFRRHWGWKRTNTKSTKTTEYGVMEANWEAIDTQMRELSDELNMDGWEIKSVIPLISSEYQTHALLNSTGAFQGAWGGGHGYGAAYSDGIVLLCQRAIEMSAEQYAARQGEIADRKALKLRQAALKQEATAIRAEVIEPVSKGVFKGSTYRYGGVEYATESEAAAVREARARDREDSA